MNKEHQQQCNHVDHTIGEQVRLLVEKIERNNDLTEQLAQKVSAVGSDLKSLEKKVDANHDEMNKHHEEMRPWLEAKIGLNLLWRWGISIPIIIAVLLGIKTLLGWLGFHK